MERFTYICPFIVKDPDEHPDEEVHRAKSRRVLSAGASVPMELGCTALLPCVQQLVSSLKLIV